MGLIKKVFGAIFSLVAAIFKGIFGIFGIGKKDQYYLELDEAKGEAPKVAEAAPAQKAEPAPSNPPQTEQASAAPAATQSQPAPKPAAASSPSPERSSLTQPSGMAVASAKADPEPAGTFATDYLVNPKIFTRSRRRPGPCLSNFKDMARQMQAPSRG